MPVDLITAVDADGKGRARHAELAVETQASIVGRIRDVADAIHADVINGAQEDRVAVGDGTARALHVKPGPAVASPAGPVDMRDILAVGRRSIAEVPREGQRGAAGATARCVSAEIHGQVGIRVSRRHFLIGRVLFHRHGFRNRYCSGGTSGRVRQAQRRNGHQHHHNTFASGFAVVHCSSPFLYCVRKPYITPEAHSTIPTSNKDQPAQCLPALLLSERATGVSAARAGRGETIGDGDSVT